MPPQQQQQQQHQQQHQQQNLSHPPTPALAPVAPPEPVQAKGRTRLMNKAVNSRPKPEQPSASPQTTPTQESEAAESKAEDEGPKGKSWADMLKHKDAPVESEAAESKAEDEGPKG